MSAPNPYIYPIEPFNGDPGDDYLHQASPTWVLTFIRWNIRDTLRTHVSQDLAVRQSVVVENDCVSLSVSDNKGSLTQSMQAVLVQTDINYETAIAPGDFVIVNILNWEKDARRVAKAAKAGQPINDVDDGFKGFFKVQSVRKTLAADPATGIVTVRFSITGFAFTEFNNIIYFNPNLINPKGQDNFGLYINDIAPAWRSFATLAGKPPLQDLIAFLIQSLIGMGVNQKAANPKGLVTSPNEKFVVPLLVGKYLGVVIDDKPASQDYATVTSAAKVYNYLFGIQTYNNASGNAQITAGQGLNPTNLNATQKYPNFYYTNQNCAGNTILKAEYWNQVSVWSIINQYTNAPLNELYTCFKVNPKTNRVMPTLVFRQIPFTSEDYSTQKFGPNDANPNNRNAQVTRFMTLPRWKINPSMVSSVDLGREEAARVNFVQFYVKSAFSENGMDMAEETGKGNYFFDKDDVKRSGLRPYVIQNQMQDLPDAGVNVAPVWARIMADALIGGHLRLNGTLVCNGIVDPITVGDNLEFDGTVFHIEQITHTCSVNPASGIKSFRTSIAVSHGVSINSSSAGTVYSEMTYSNAYLDRKDDAQNNQILPGVSEAQDTQYRPNTVEYDPNIAAGGEFRNNPFPQPNLSSSTKATKAKGRSK